MRSLLFILLLASSVALWAQQLPSAPAPQQNSQTPDSTTAKPPTASNPELEPPRSDRVNIRDLGNADGESSSKDTQIDVSPPSDDAKAHPRSSEVLTDVPATSGGSSDVGEFHPWDPHKSAKDVEVGDFYFKRKNYRAAEDRYREALYYKDNDAIATFKLAICLEKLNRNEEARAEFESYLKILPHGPESENAQKAIDRLKAVDSDAKAAK